MRNTKKNKSSLKQQITPFITSSLKKTVRSFLDTAEKKSSSTTKKNISNIYLKDVPSKSKRKKKQKCEDRNKSQENKKKIQTLNKKLFPFQAIKFKEKQKVVLNQKELNQSFINNNKQNFSQHTLKSNLLNVGVHPRLVKYAKQKNSNKIQDKIQVHDALFHEAVKRIFKSLDIFSRGTISESNISKRISQSVLYFLGAVFQKIKNQKLHLNIKQFSNLCDQVYLVSQKEDIKGFIKSVLDQNGQNFQSMSIQQDLSSFRNLQQNQLKAQSFMQSSLLQQKIIFNNKKKSFLNEAPLSFQNKQNSIISFRRQSKQNKDLDSFQYQSAKFPECQNIEQSLQNNLKKQQKQNMSKTWKQSRTSNGQCQKIQKNNNKEQQNILIKSGQIRKNRLQQINNLRNQILQDMKNIKEMKLQDNKVNLKSLYQIKPKSTSYKQPQKYSQNTLNHRLKLQQQNKQNISDGKQQKNKSELKWINNSHKLTGSFNELQKVREQFNEQKRIIQNNQKQRQKYFQVQIKKFNQKEQSKNMQYFEQKINNPLQIYEKNIQRLSKSSNLSSSLQRNKNQITLMQSRMSASNRNDQNSKQKGIDKIEKLSLKIEEYLQKNIIKMERSKEVSGKTVFF